MWGRRREFLPSLQAGGGEVRHRYGRPRSEALRGEVGKGGVPTVWHHAALKVAVKHGSPRCGRNSLLRARPLRLRGARGSATWG
jgi:hypothetical protein